MPILNYTIKRSGSTLLLLVTAPAFLRSFATISKFIFTDKNLKRYIYTNARVDNIVLLLYPTGWSSPGIGKWGEASSTTCGVTGTAKVTGTAEGSVTAERIHKMRC